MSNQILALLNLNTTSTSAPQGIIAATQVVRDVATLCTIPKGTAVVIQTLGYYNPNDRGSGLYWYDASDLSSADDGGAVIVANDGGRWKLFHDGTVSVRQYGAVGDGTTDDTAKIQACLNNSAIDSVYFPNGTYVTTAILNVNNTSRIFGDTQLTSSIFMKHTFTGLLYSNVNTYGMVIENLQIKGTGAGTGVRIESTTEITAHMRFLNVRFAILTNGIFSSSAVAYGLFDSTLDKCDFIQCSGVAWTCTGSQNSAVGCTFRACGFGIQLNSSSGGAAGPILQACTFILNSYDIVVGTTTVRPMVIHGCWFEQTANLTVGKVTGGSEVLFNGLHFDKCLFQPGASSLGGGVIDGFNFKGNISFSKCILYKDLFAGATLPAETVGDSNCNVSRESCMIIDGAGTITILKDFTTSDSVNFKRLYDNRKYANDAAAGAAGLTIGDMYYNSTSALLTIKN